VTFLSVQGVGFDPCSLKRLEDEHPGPFLLDVLFGLQRRGYLDATFLPCGVAARFASVNSGDHGNPHTTSNEAASVFSWGRFSLEHRLRRSGVRNSHPGAVSFFSDSLDSFDQVASK
jgi:hypothetical protein